VADCRASHPRPRRGRHGVFGLGHHLRHHELARTWEVHGFDWPCVGIRDERWRVYLPSSRRRNSG
jgi:hypothetical protein